MSKLINEIKENYSVIPNVVFQDRRLDYRCKGLLCTLVSLPNGWTFSVSGLVALVTTEDGENPLAEGKSAVTSAINRLEKFGYLDRVPVKERGQFAGYDYQIHIPAIER